VCAHRERFDEAGVANLTFVVATINAWNRLAIASRTPPGSYQPMQSSQHA
jgi:alkylhydroperoxidase family enzyme